MSTLLLTFMSFRRGYETIGLVTLEALAAGTPCRGSGPCVDDYFMGAAGVWTHRPGNERGLRSSILAALNEPRGQGVQLAASFNWGRTAQELLDAYQS